MFGNRFSIFNILKKSAEVLLKSGEFDAAQITYRWIVKFWPTELRPYFALSAIAHKSGDKRTATTILRRGLDINPCVKKPNDDPTSTRLLRVRGVQNSVYMLGKRNNGDYKVKLRGGNFHDGRLTRFSRFSVINYFIIDENILADSNIAKFDIVLSLISDPDVEQQSLEALSTFLSRYPQIPVINHPDQVLLTTRDNNYQRLKSIDGIHFPKTHRFVISQADLQDCQRFVARHDFSFPLLLRETGTHFGRSVKKIGDIAALSKYVQNQTADEIYVIQYEDGRFSDQIFRKMRVFFIGGEIYPVVCHFDTLWNVHGNNRRDVMLRQPWMMEHERAFTDDSEAYVGPQAFAGLKKLAGIIELDFFGVDFTVLEDQSLLIFEINPAMRHSYDHAVDFPYLRPHLERITEAFDEMMLRKLNLGSKSTDVPVKTTV